MFDKILIANRGEIACRIIKTARAMGVRTVAVYSDEDVQAVHVRDADEAVRLGPAPAADSYLRGDLLIAAALQTGAQAIHPGYGFLSENPDFVAAVEQAGLVFIGPSSDAIRAMGLKDAAKALMAEAGVPVVPGYHGSNQDPADLAREAAKIGYPVLIKAVAGGGGKGMRVVDTADLFAACLAAAQSEARASFGNAAVLIEKYILSPRHIEVQIFGDGRDVIHLYERDCSLQRRHQKVIEEAPAPGMTRPVRDAICAAAVRAAKAIGYKGAGTVEFIVDTAQGLRADGFWFMEMNTRLQVEYPVTEAILGIDLVAWQLHVAAGGSLPQAQADLCPKGHAIEARIYAEDVAAGFLPATGTLQALHFPAGIRVDCGLKTGDTVSPWYDPMIAKITAHGPDRDQALRSLQAALDATQIAGPTTNTGFLRRLVRDAGFVAGDVDTGLIDRGADTLCAAPVPPDRVLAVAAVVAIVLQPVPWAGFTLWEPLVHVVSLPCGNTVDVVQLSVQGADRCDAVVRGTPIRLSRHSTHWGLPAVRHADTITVFADDIYRFVLDDPLSREAASVGGDAILAPMPGLVRDVAVTVGQTVRVGDPVAILEAMKMEHVLRAPRDGIIAQVAVHAGAQVVSGALIATLEPDTGDGTDDT